MPLFEVRHQATAQFLLQRALSSGRLPHAYIFHGPQGVGKRMLAERFAKVLLCTQRSAPRDPPAEYADLHVDWVEACGSCRGCTLVAAGTHPDYHLIHRQLIKFHPDADVRQRKAVALGVDVIRHFVIEATGKKPTLGPAKIFVVQEAETLSGSAQNALLKTLEEPPPDTYILLLARALDTLLPTTRSRCQAIPFMLLPEAFVTDTVRRLLPQVPAEQIEGFSRFEPGSIGRTLNLIADGFFESRQQITASLLNLNRHNTLQLARQIEDLAGARGKFIKERLKPPSTTATAAAAVGPSLVDYDADITEAEASRRAVGTLLALIAGVYRDVVHISCEVSAEHADASLRPLARRLGAEGARQAILVVNATEAKINRNAYTKLCLDELAIKLARLHHD